MSPFEPVLDDGAVEPENTLTTACPPKDKLPEIAASPLTSSLQVGDDVPIPTLPSAAILIFSVLLVYSLIGLLPYA